MKHPAADISEFGSEAKVVFERDRSNQRVLLVDDDPHCMKTETLQDQLVLWDGDPVCEDEGSGRLNSGGVQQLRLRIQRAARALGG